MTYAEEMKKNEQVRQNLADKLTEAAKLINYEFDAEKWNLTPKNPFMPQLKAFYPEYKTSDKINVTSYNRFGYFGLRKYKTINISIQKDTRKIATEILRRALDGDTLTQARIDAQKERNHQNEQAELRREYEEIFSTYSNNGFTVAPFGNSDTPITPDGKFSVKKGQWNNQTEYKLNATIKSKYALIQIIKILKEDK